MRRISPGRPSISTAGLRTHRARRREEPKPRRRSGQREKITGWVGQMVQRIVVLGAGFAGLWSAAGAARALDLYRVEGVEILVIDRTNYHSIRVRNYEAELGDTIVSLKNVLDPIGVRHLKGNGTCVDVA